MATNLVVKTVFSAVDSLTAPIKRMQRAFGGLNNSVQKTKSITAGVVKGMLGFAALQQGFSFFRSMVTDFNDAETAGAQLDATLRSTNNAVGLSRDALEAMSKSLAKTSIYDDDAITGMQSVLATFTSVKGAIYKEALPAILDMSSKLGTDLQSSAIMVGKALQDPVKGITALRRVGVNFNDQQIKMIKNLVKSGKTAQAQAYILKELKTEFGGSAAAAAKAGTGPLKIIENQFGNIKEAIGGLMMKGFSKLFPFMERSIEFFGRLIESTGRIKDALSPLTSFIASIGKEIFSTFSSISSGFSLDSFINGLKEFFKWLDPLFKAIAYLFSQIWKGITELLKSMSPLIGIFALLFKIARPVLVFIIKLFADLIPVVVAVVKFLWPVVAVIAAIAAGIWIYNTAMTAFAIVTNAGLWPILAIIAAIAAVVLIIENWGAITEWFGKMWETFTTWISGLWEGVVSAFQNFDFLNFFKQIGNAIINYFLFPLKGILKLISFIPGKIGKMAQKGLEAVNKLQFNVDQKVENNAALNPDAANQQATAQMFKVKSENSLNVNIKDQTGLAWLPKQPEGTKVNLTSTKGWQSTQR